MDVFDLVAKISLDTSEYTEGLDEAGKDSESFGSKFSNGLATAGKVAGVVTGAVTAVSGAIAKQATATAKYGDEIDKNSQKMGLSAQTYQEYDYVLTLAGTSMSEMGTGLKTLTNKIGDATAGSKESQEMFKQLGISMDDLSKMSREDIFKATIAGLQGMEDSTERASLANDLFGKSGQTLTPLFNTTNEQTQELISNLHEMGGVMSDEAVKSSADFNDSITTFQTALKGLTNGAMSEFLPVMTDVMNGLTKVFAGDSSGLGQVKQGISQFMDKLTEVLPEMLDFGVDIIITLAEGIIDALPQLIEKLPEIITKIVSVLIDNLPKLLEASVQIVIALAKGIIQSLPQLIRQIPNIIVSIKNAFISGVSSFSQIGTNIINGIWNGLANGWSWLVNKVKNLASDLLNSAKSALGIHSPSKEFAKIGQFCVDGFNETFEELAEGDVFDGMEAKLGNMSIDAQGTVGVTGTAGGDSSMAVNITLAGDADGIFRVVKQETQKYYKSTGRSAFAY